MRWKKGFMVMLVLLTAVMMNTEYNFAAVTDTDPAVPDHGKVLLEYEGNEQAASHNYYRLAVKYSAESGKVITVPKNIVIYETNLNPKVGEEAGEIEVHRVNFGEDAGKSLEAIGKKPFLDKFDAFYYRNFIVKHNPKSKYKYRAVVTWENSSGKELIRTVETEVNVTKEVSTQALMIGTQNNFSRETWVGAFDKDATYLPKKYTDPSGTEYGYSVDKDDGNEIYDGVWSITAEEGLMDKKGWNSNYINIDTIPLVGGGTTDKNIFIANASLETHVIYTGDQLLGKTVKVYINNPSAIGNSLDVGSTREIPALSESLTKLIRADQGATPTAPAGVYPKEHTEVYMGMGSGPQGDIGDGDNKNDMSFIFGFTNGTIHGTFQLLVLDETGAAVPGFVFDYIKLTYNPIIFTSGIKVKDAGYVKPEGFLMLNTKFKLENLPASIPGNKIPDAMIRISLQNVLDSDLNDYTHFLNKDGTPFDGGSIAFTLDGTVITKCISPACNHALNELKCNPDTYAYNAAKKELVVKSVGELIPKNNYSVKIIIPTKRKDGGKTVTMYNDNIVGVPGDVTKPGKKYPIKMEIIENHYLLDGRNDQLVRYDINFEINPYKMPGIN